MYMRLVHARLKKGVLPILQSDYEKKVVPALQNVRGCLYAGLMQSARRQEECISMTLWESEEYGRAYEQSGLFTTLLDGVRPLFLESSESRTQLSEDLRIEYVAVPEEPEVKTFSVEVANGTPSFSPRPSLWLRTVSLRLGEGMSEEFIRLYRDHAIPALRALPGCLYVFLTANAVRKDEVISVTVWNSEQAAEDYERSGLFQELLESQKHTFSRLFRWKLEEDKSTSRRAVTSEDLVVEGFKLLVGRSFR